MIYHFSLFIAGKTYQWKSNSREFGEYTNKFCLHRSTFFFDDEIVSDFFWQHNILWDKNYAQSIFYRKYSTASNIPMVTTHLHFPMAIKFDFSRTFNHWFGKPLHWLLFFWSCFFYQLLFLQDPYIYMNFPYQYIFVNREIPLPIPVGCWIETNFEQLVNKQHTDRWIWNFTSFQKFNKIRKFFLEAIFILYSYEFYDIFKSS